MKWQPIETAPKDCKILLWYEERGEGGVTVGRWNVDEFAKNPKPYWSTEKGYLFGRRWERDTQFTHWMPIPAPPSEETS